MSGVDTIHAGMLNGYSNSDENEMVCVLNILERYNVVPALSCGMHPGLVQSIRNRIGIDWMANVGGAIHGHDGGTLAGTKAMRQAIDNDLEKPEYRSAIEKWGLKK
jgi:ribulose 1,5-bisphosphate carboxylase large subunit-like protein